MKMRKCKKCGDSKFVYETGKCIKCTFSHKWINKVKEKQDEGL
jgi:ribosomal protein L37E